MFEEFRQLQPNRSNQKEVFELIVMANVIKLSEVDIATSTLCDVSVNGLA